MRILSLISAALAAAGLLAASPTVTKVAAQQRYPWNGKVDIVVTVRGTSNDVAAATCIFTATNSATRAALAMKSVTGAGTAPVAAGTGSDTWTRRYVWDATADLGEVQIADVAINAEAKILGGVQLWKDGPYWAECNVGASRREDYGHYFWWGDTVGYKSVGSGWNAADGSKTGFIFGGDCPTFEKDTAALKALGYIDETGNLVAAHDAATVRLGAPWRMPTTAEIEELHANCTTTWMERDGVYGCYIAGKGDYATKYIFLPAGGNGFGDELFGKGSFGSYWTSTMYMDSPEYSIHLDFYLDNFFQGHDYRYGGRSVRPIRDCPR